MKAAACKAETKQWHDFKLFFWIVSQVEWSSLDNSRKPAPVSAKNPRPRYPHDRFPPCPANSIEYTAKSCIFTQTHVMLDSCRKTRANPRRNVQSPHRFSRNESRVTEKKVSSNFTKTALFNRKVSQRSKISRKPRRSESARFFINLHVCKTRLFSFETTELKDAPPVRES